MRQTDEVPADAVRVHMYPVVHLYSGLMEDVAEKIAGHPVVSSTRADYLAATVPTTSARPRLNKP